MKKLIIVLFSVTIFNSSSLLLSQNLYSLLEADISSDKIQKFINHFGDSPEILRFDEVYYYSFSKKGISLSFNNSNKLLAIFLYAEGEDDFRQYQGKLPYNLKFSFSRMKVEKILGKPDQVNESEYYRIRCEYYNKNTIIEYKTKSSKDINSTIGIITIVKIIHS